MHCVRVGHEQRKHRTFFKASDVESGVYLETTPCIIDFYITGHITNSLSLHPPKQNVRAFWLSMSIRFPTRDYIVYEDERYTYADAARRVEEIAGLLWGRCGVRCGDRGT